MSYRGLLVREITGRKSCAARRGTLFLAAVAAVLAAGASAYAADTASVTFSVILNPPSIAATNVTVTATLKEGSAKPQVTATFLPGTDNVVKLPLQKTTGVLYNGRQNRGGVPVISAARDGRVALHLPPQSYGNADIALFSIDGKRVLQGKASAAEAGSFNLSRANVARGVYLLSVKGTGGEEYAARITHGGGSLNVNVAFGGEKLSPAAKMAKQAAVGDWTIKVSAGGYVDSTYVLNPESGTVPKQVITLKATVALGPINRNRQNVVYVPNSTNDRHKLDLKLPDSTFGNGPFPLIMFIHGGAFTQGSKSVDAPFSNGLKKGYATAALGYRLASSSAKAFPEAVEDLLAAIRHLRANAAEYRLDPDKFAVTGFSAGGYFTALIASINGGAHEFNETTLGNAGVSSKVQVAVSWSALTDFTKLNAQQQELGGSWMMQDHYADGQALALFFGMKVTVPPQSGSAIDVALKKSNPFTYVTSANCPGIPPILMQHGTSDNLVPWKQSEILVNKLNEVCGSGKAELTKVQGGGHGNLSGQENTIFNFLDSKLGIAKNNI